MTISRRRFGKILGGTALGGAALSAGMLPQLFGGGRASAQVGTGPTRFLAVRTPHGVDRD